MIKCSNVEVRSRRTAHKRNSGSEGADIYCQSPDVSKWSRSLYSGRSGDSLGYPATSGSMPEQLTWTEAMMEGTLDKKRYCNDSSFSGLEMAGRRGHINKRQSGPYPGDVCSLVYLISVNPHNIVRQKWSLGASGP